MRLFSLIMLLSFSISAADWQKDYTKVIQNAKSQGKAVLIDFYADWCGPCRKMAETTLKSDLVLKELKNFILLKIDIDKEKELSIKFQVSAIPHFIILNRHAEIVSELKGYSSAENFSSWISSHKQQALSTSKVAELSNTDKALVTSLKTEPVKGLEKFIALYKQSPIAKKTSLLKLSEGLQTQQLFACLQHPNLEMRLFATHIITASQKEPFLFDPWAPLKTREQQLAKLKEKF